MLTFYGQSFLIFVPDIKKRSIKKKLRIQEKIKRFISINDIFNE